MPPKFHSARAYVAFDEAIRNVETWVGPRSPRFCEFDGHDVAKRLVQRFVEIGLNEFVLTCVRRLERGLEPLPDAGSSYSCGGLIIDSAGGRVRIRPALLLRSLGVFLGHWSHALLVHLIALLKSPALSRGRATLVHGVGSAELTRGGSDSDFLAFCRAGPIAPLRNARRLIVQVVGPMSTSNAETCSYHRVPLLGLVLENPIGTVEFLRFLSSHAQALFDFVFAVARLRAVCVLGRDFAYHATAMRLNRQGLIESIIITNSNYTAQPLWMRPYPWRSYSTHMVWYSQNSIPVVYAFDPIRTQLPNHRHFAFDETWVWTDGYADYIQNLGIGAVIHVVGPIVWYLPEPPSRERRTDEIRIMVFDVTPVRPEVAQRIGLLYNYYSAENVLRFIEDIVSAARRIETKLGRKVCVVLKHKRSHEPTRDPRYIAAIERLVCGQDAMLSLEALEANLYSLTSGSDVVIAIPYSSPVHVATYTGTPAMYYDPTCELLPEYDAAAGVAFAAGDAELGDKLAQLLSAKPRQARHGSEAGYPRTA